MAVGINHYFISAVPPMVEVVEKTRLHMQVQAKHIKEQF